MNDDTTVYNEAAMREGVDALNKAHKAFGSVLEELKGQLGVSLGQWEDTAREAYQDIQRQWDASAKRQENIIQQMPIILNEISEGYQTTEKVNYGHWQGR